jgi:medium-chain acyl-[acyl-carrier-protein] hydrolase
VFAQWFTELPGYLEGYIAHYPGRGSRYREPAIRNLPDLVEGLCQAIKPLLDRPFAFFGHSLGALVAFELARQSKGGHLPQPGILFVSACGAPHLPDPHAPIHALPEADFLKSLRALNGIPAEVVNHPELMDLLLPTLRADFEALEAYRYISNEPALNCPIVALGGLEDPRVSRERLEGWAQQSNAFFRLQYFPGDHFFIHTTREAVLATLTAELSALHEKH